MDDFRDQVYQSDSLAPAADAFGLAIQQSDWLTKDSKASNPWLENKQLRAQLFSAEVLKDRHNTEVIEVTPNVFVAARVADYKPQTRTPLKEVAPSLASRLKNQ